MADVEIYTSMFCGFCHRAKRLLDSKGVSYTEIDVMLDAKRRQEMRERAGGRTSVPQIFIGGAHIGGSAEAAGARGRWPARPIARADLVTAAFTVACIQMTTGLEPAESLDQAEALIRQAADQGADLVLTPETTDLMAANRRAALDTARPEEEHLGLSRLGGVATELGLWLLAGSLVVKLTEDRLANRAFLFDPRGRIAARYDKIHMFDVEIPDGQSYRESRTYRPGREAVVAELPWGGLGLTICYDLRFPGLYRSLARAGAAFLTVPSAFTRYTGEAHWHVLLRARAIETGCYVFAPAQCGDHPSGRQTYGHSLIVDPWGRVLADGGTAPVVVVAEVDPAAVAAARGKVPALENGRDFSEPVPGTAQVS